MLKRRTFLAAVGAATALSLAPRATFAESNHEHLTIAAAETREAIHEGKRHMFSSFAEYAQNALDRAGAVTGPDPNNHVQPAIARFKQALRVAKRSHQAARLERGIHHAERALIHLKVAANC